MIVYVWERRTNRQIEKIKHVLCVESLSESFAIVLDTGEVKLYKRKEYKLTCYSY